MNCLKCQYDLCSVHLNCEGESLIETNFIATMNGKYTMKLNFLDVVLIKEQDFLIGESLNFLIKNLNENYAYNFWIENSDGVVLEYVSPNNKKYSNFTFTTKLSKYID